MASRAASTHADLATIRDTYERFGQIIIDTHYTADGGKWRASAATPPAYDRAGDGPAHQVAETTLG